MQFSRLKPQKNMHTHTSFNGTTRFWPSSFSENIYLWGHLTSDLDPHPQALHSDCTSIKCLFSNRTGHQVGFGRFSPIIPVQVTTNKMQMEQVIVYLHIFDVSPCVGVIFVCTFASFRAGESPSFLNLHSLNCPVNLYFFWHFRI